MTRHERLLFAATHCLMPLALSFLLSGCGDPEQDPVTPPADQDGIAAGYVGDVGIENHPEVIWVERFDAGSLTAVFSRYTDVRNGAGMSLVPDVPPGSPTPSSLRITAVGGQNDGGHLYRPLLQSGDELYFRFYVKYGSTGTHHHSGFWTGGYNPQTTWPQGGAGQRPAGHERFTIGFEGTGAHMDFYTYWMGMRGGATSNPETGQNYWGNSLINHLQGGVAVGEWIGYEIRVKINDPPSATNGELGLWRNGELIFEMGPGTRGSWSGDRFTAAPSGSAFEGFQWRSVNDLGLGFIWMMLYSTANPPGVVSTLQFDHVVVARSYVGPLRAAP